MMAKNQRHLYELLKEDQEPFILKNYITDRRCRIKRAPTIKNHLQLQVKKQNPISETAKFPLSLCRNACFLVKESPEIRKSPLFDFQSPVKSPCRSPRAIFLNVPKKTAALLLEAALKIHKQTASSSCSKPKSHKNNNGIELFGSIFKKLSLPHRSRKREIAGDNPTVAVKNNPRCDSSVVRRKSPNGNEEQVQAEMELYGGCNDDSSGSGIWSQSNEVKSFDFEASISSSSLFASKHIAGEFHTENDFSESPFGFVLQRITSSGQRTPEFLSPTTSPSHHKEEENLNAFTESLQKEQVDEEEEEEKEQCSPVSVLDRPFEDDDEEEGDSFDLDCSFAIVQRAKQELLRKLRRFERLAEMDTIELEKRMLEADEDSERDTDEQDQEGDDEDYQTTLNNKNEVDWFVRDILNTYNHTKQVPEDLKRLVSDLIMEEERETSYAREEVAKRVCKRLESLKDIESNTIDIMVEQDFRRESICWKLNQKQVEEVAVQIELAIFGTLVEELSDEDSD